MSLHVFVGPTLAREEVLALVPGAVVHPPVAHGDVTVLGAGPGDTVVIIDGYYHQRGAVRHKELLGQLASGVRVVGCSSMGALRAAELHPYGMIGHGTVFRMYRDDVIDADDEVAVAHGPAPEYDCLSTPLVAVRHAVDAAYREGLLAAGEAADVVDRARSIPYQQRSWRAVGHCQPPAAPSLLDALKRLGAFLDRHPEHGDIKAADARDTLSRLARGELPSGPPGAWVASTDWRSRAHHDWDAEFAGASGGDTTDGGGATEGGGGTTVGAGPTVGNAAVLRHRQVYDTEFPALWRRLALTRIGRETDAAPAAGADTGPAAGAGAAPAAGADAAPAAGADAAPAAEARESRALARAAHRGLTPAELTPHQKTAWLTAREAIELTPREGLLSILVRSYRPPLGAAAVIAALPGLVDDARTRRTVAECHAVNDEVARWGPGQSIVHLADTVLVDHLKSVWGLPGATDRELTAAARDRGFASLEAAVAAVRPFFLHRRLGAREAGAPC